jgi:hypothetical protein
LDGLSGGDPPPGAQVVGGPSALGSIF